MWDSATLSASTQRAWVGLCNATLSASLGDAQRGVTEAPKETLEPQAKCEEGFTLNVSPSVVDVCIYAILDCKIMLWCYLCVPFMIANALILNKVNVEMDGPDGIGESCDC